MRVLAFSSKVFFRVFSLCSSFNLLQDFPSRDKNPLVIIFCFSSPAGRVCVFHFRDLEQPLKMFIVRPECARELMAYEDEFSLAKMNVKDCLQEFLYLVDWKAHSFPQVHHKKHEI